MRKKRAFARFGITVPEGIYEEYKGRPDETMIKGVVASISEANIDAQELLRLKHLELEAVEDRAVPIQGAKEFVNWAKSKFRIECRAKHFSTIIDFSPPRQSQSSKQTQPRGALPPGVPRSGIGPRIGPKKRVKDQDPGQVATVHLRLCTGCTFRIFPRSRHRGLIQGAGVIDPG